MSTPDLLERKDYFGGLDLGQQSDFSALIVIERTFLEPPPGPRVEVEHSAALGKQITIFDHRPRPVPPKHKAQYRVIGMRRWDLGTPYPKIQDDVVGIYAQAPLSGSQLVIDATGVGLPVVDWFRRQKPKCILRPVVITAGTKVTEDAATGGWNVAKKALVSALQVVLQGRRLVVPDSHPLTPILREEMANFRVKITAAANESFEAWREGQHDDIVLSIAMAVWLAERGAVEFFVR